MDLVTVYFKNAEGAVSPVKLVPLDANHAVQRRPRHWSRTADGFASPPEGAVFSTGDGGGRGRLAGASVKAG